MDRSVGNRTEPNRTEPNPTVGTPRRDAHAKARKTTAKPNPMKVATAFPNEPTSAPGTRETAPSGGFAERGGGGGTVDARVAREEKISPSFFRCESKGNEDGGEMKSVEHGEEEKKTSTQREASERAEAPDAPATTKKTKSAAVAEVGGRRRSVGRRRGKAVARKTVNAV